MKNNLVFVPFLGQDAFELSDHRIDAKKYTLYDVVVHPQLNKLRIPERLRIFNSWHDDLVRKRMINFSRYAIDGNGTERNMVDPTTGKVESMVNFGSNDYLNMSQHPAVIEAAIHSLRQYGAGAGASCNASGLTHVKLELEKEIADCFGYDKALVYPSGFMANVGVLSALLRERDVAVVDMFAHASIMDGLVGKNKMIFRHNDMRSLEAMLMRAQRQFSNIIVVVDGVYSMDGDIANLPEISGLCEKYKALLMVDEAHAFGVIGKHGMGVLDHFNMRSKKIDILTGTLSKAVGSSGGFVTGRKGLINYLNLASRSYFFTTAPFIASNAAALESIRIIRQEDERRESLWKNIDYFKGKLRQGGFNMGRAETAIFPVILGDHNMVIDVTRMMGERGVLTNGIPYPAVPRKQTRIRMTVTAEMTEDQLDKGYAELCGAIRQYKEEYQEQAEQEFEELRKVI
jgi:glycine C-acetyltransferase